MKYTYETYRYDAAERQEKAHRHNIAKEEPVETGRGRRNRRRR